MSEVEPEVVQGASDKDKLKELVEKDSKTGRAMSGMWLWLASGLGVFMVLFYLYCAAVPVDTQYFYGLYVLITYILVFLNYPLSSKGRGEKASWSEGIIPIFALTLAAYFAVVLLVGGKEGQMLLSSTWFNLVFALAFVAAVLVSYPLWSKPDNGSPNLLDVVLCLLAVFVVGYYIAEFEALNYRMGSETLLDTAVSAVGIFVSVEVARRVLGWSMTIVGLTFLAYAFWGDLLHYVPVLKAFGHTGFNMDRALNHIYLKQEGVFGIMARVLVTYVILFIFFGSFLKSSGASKFFLDLPMALAGKTVGGPAKVAVIASGFFGSVSGSAIANTVSTGAFTIPLMKKAGFRPHVAGAIEPSASIGGMFMPPIMGAGGFIMAEMTEIPYVDIMLMAIFPAVIYFLSVFVMIHFEAKKYGLVGIQEPNAPTAMDILKKEWYMSSPLLIIVVLMLMGRSPGMAAFWAIAACSMIMLIAKIADHFQRRDMDPARVAFFLPSPIVVVVGLALLDWLENSGAIWVMAGWVALVAAVAAGEVSRQGGKSAGALLGRVAGDFVKDVFATMVEGSRNTLIIGATVGVIGIIVGTIALTGIGLKFSQIIIELSFNILPLAILLIGVASLVLGMGVPVTAAYLITVVLTQQAVTDMIALNFFNVNMAELQLPLGNLLADDPKRLLITAQVSWVLIAGHMIVYWFSQDSNITPPVCVAAYAGAAIAGSDPWKTGWTSFKFAKMLYVGPFLFAFSPSFLLGGPGHIIPWYDVIIDWATIILGTIAFGSLTMGYLLCTTTIIEWIIFAVATLLLFFPHVLIWATGINMPSLLVDFLGMALWGVVWAMQKLRIKKNPNLVLPLDERKKLRQAAAL